MRILEHLIPTPIAGSQSPCILNCKSVHLSPPHQAKGVEKLTQQWSWKPRGGLRMHRMCLARRVLVGADHVEVLQLQPQARFQLLLRLFLRASTRVLDHLQSRAKLGNETPTHWKFYESLETGLWPSSTPPG